MNYTIKDRIYSTFVYNLNIKKKVMKLKNIFRKNKKTATKSIIEKIQKNQLEKVIGGTEICPPAQDDLQRTGTK